MALVVRIDVNDLVVLEALIVTVKEKGKHVDLGDDNVRIQRLVDRHGGEGT